CLLTLPATTESDTLSLHDALPIWREIGILKALGASDRDVKGLFFAEAGVMGMVGGAAGVALGWAIGHAINFGANIYLQRQNLPPDRKSTRLNSSHGSISYAVFCLK